jgi:hypothetical protein
MYIEAAIFHCSNLHIAQVHTETIRNSRIRIDLRTSTNVRQIFMSFTSMSPGTKLSTYQPLLIRLSNGERRVIDKKPFLISRNVLLLVLVFKLNSKSLSLEI